MRASLPRSVRGASARAPACSGGRGAASTDASGVEGAWNVDRRPVESTLIRSVGYDLDNSILEVEFVEGGRVYTYYDVPLSVFSELLDAESIGGYFNESIRDLYSYEDGGKA
jgi:hypothetical protein